MEEESGKPLTTKDRILDASIELFSNKGFHGVSIREIARAVGIKESSIYNHFSSKENILDTIFDQFQAAMEETIPSKERIEKALEGASFNEFWRMGSVSFASKTQTPRMGNISKIILYEMFRNERARDLALTELFTRQQDVVRMIFGVMMEKGVIAEVDLDALSNAYSYAMLGMQMEWSLRRSWGLDVSSIEGKMARHIGFIGELFSV